MNFTKTLTNLTSFQQLCAAVLLIVVGVGAGYTVSVSTHANVQTHENVPIDQQFRDFDIFAYKSQEVDAMMQKVIANPTEYNKMYAHDELIIVYRSWAEGESGKNKQVFLGYLYACLGVVDSPTPDHIADLTEMNQLKQQLN